MLSHRRCCRLRSAHPATPLMRACADRPLERAAPSSPHREGSRGRVNSTSSLSEWLRLRGTSRLAGLRRPRDMKIAIVGGSGALGRKVTNLLRSRGHETRVLSRRAAQFRVDLTTGEGLPWALAGCDVVINASNDSSRRAVDTLVRGSQRLLVAARAAGVRHYICVSMVGCDRLPIHYCRTKWAQEQVTEQEGVPWSIVRATQFHELLNQAFSSLARWGLLPLPAAPLRPVASVEVANVLAETAEGQPLRRQIHVAGPEVADVSEFARRWRARSGRPAVLLPLPFPGALGRAIRAGALSCEHPDIQGQIAFSDAIPDSATS